MLTKAGEVKILDFGLARVDNTDFAKDDPNRIKGTPIYMAPEQARGEDIDHRTDLFALGLILYELLMGRPAYRVPMDVPDPIAAVFAAIEGGELSDQCRELETKLPGMGPIVAKLLQARPRNRYQTGHDLLVDLRRQLYKDRGVYLTEFCDFFFGSLYKLPDLPDADPGQGGTRMSTNDKAPRKSMEERLRALDASIERTNARMDEYAERLQRHGIEGAEREVSWLEDLIEVERGAREKRKETRERKRAVKAAARPRRGTT